jgi:phosphatidylethanolamine/phosphatidyl-N-methylethanolamine N-methyltransferase
MSSARPGETRLRGESRLVRTHVREVIELWRQTARDSFHTGSVAPSSRHLARAITEEVPANHPPRHILEVGPGTGPFTRELAAKLLPGDTLTLCEINHHFVQHLENWRRALPPDRREQIAIHRGDILKHNGQGYHHIVCGLPFTNFPPKLVEDIFAHFHVLGLPQSTLSFFEYYGVRPMKRQLPPQLRGSIREVDELIRGYAHKAEIRQKIVWRNFPPALVRHFRVAALTDL